METAVILIIALLLALVVLDVLMFLQLSSQDVQLNYLNEWKDSIKAYQCLNPCQFP